MKLSILAPVLLPAASLPVSPRTVQPMTQAQISAVYRLPSPPTPPTIRIDLDDEDLLGGVAIPAPRPKTPLTPAAAAAIEPLAAKQDAISDHAKLNVGRTLDQLFDKSRELVPSL